MTNHCSVQGSFRAQTNMPDPFAMQRSSQPCFEENRSDHPVSSFIDSSIIQHHPSPPRHEKPIPLMREDKAMPPDVAYVLICCFRRLILSTEVWARTTSLRNDNCPKSRRIENVEQTEIPPRIDSVVCRGPRRSCPTRAIHNLDSWNWNCRPKSRIPSHNSAQPLLGCTVLTSDYIRLFIIF